MSLALAASAGACHRSAPAPLGLARGATDLRVEVEERFYAVSGKDAPAINRALASRGPRRVGRPAHALTEWRVDWSVAPVRRGPVCESGEPHVRLEIVTTLPRWMDLGDAPSALVNDWALFMARLRHHESGHQDLAVKAGRELLAALSGLEAEDCARLMQEARVAVSQVAARYDAQHARFDRATRYGLAGDSR